MRKRAGLSVLTMVLILETLAPGCSSGRGGGGTVPSGGRPQLVQERLHIEGGEHERAIGERGAAVERSRYTMGTIASVRIESGGDPDDGRGASIRPDDPSGPSAPDDSPGRSAPLGEDALGAIAEEALDRIDEVDRAASLYRPESDLVRLNREGFPGPVPVGSVLGDLIAESLRIARVTGGAFDPSVKPLLDELGFYREIGSAPDPRGLEGALARVGWGFVRQDLREGTARFSRPGMALDLGGIGKGYALDRAADLLRSRRVRRATLTIGRSSTLLLGRAGSDPDGLFRFEVAAPELGPDRAADGAEKSVPEGSPERAAKRAEEGARTAEPERIVAIVRVPEGSVATSAPGAQVRTASTGATVGHIVDPRRGPLITNVLSATVWARTAAEADALATALVVAGPEGLRRFGGKARFEALLLISGPRGKPETVATPGLVWSPVGR